MTEPIQVDINGTRHVLAVDDPTMPLLYALRNEVGGAQQSAFRLRSRAMRCLYRC